MNSVSIDIKDKLVAAGLGTFGANSGWSINCGTQPDSPHTTITIYDTGGLNPEYAFDTAVKPLERPNFQIMVRSKSYYDSYSKMRDVVDAIDHIGAFKVGDIRYLDIQRQGDLLFLGRDDRQRYTWSANYSTFRQDKS